VATGASTAAGKRRASARSARAGRKHSGAKRPAAPGTRPAAKSAARRAPKRASRKPRARKPNRARSTRPKAKRPSKRSIFAFRRPALRTALIGVPVLLGALAAAYFLWFQNSSFVAVSDVRVKGVTTDSERITAALSDEAESMTTLNFDTARLEAATRAFPTVASVDADTDFPSGVTIHVKERPAVLLVRFAGGEVPVAGDGTILRGLDLSDGGADLPAIEVDELGQGATLSGAPLAQAQIAGAAPEPLRPLIEQLSYDDELGVEVTMRGDIPVRFGTGAAAAAKWAAAAAVLADPQLETLTYVDVRVPERPSVGGQAEPTPSADETVTTVPETVETAVTTP
jgi:cell division protein FtsQ